jgi:carbamoyltransferase
MIVAAAAGQPLPRIEGNHVLGIASTGHGASLAYVGRDGTVRSSVLDRWVRTKYTTLFARDEIESILGGKTETDLGIRNILTYSHGSFPPFRVFEDMFDDWLSWLLSGSGTTASDIDLVVTSDSYFATCSARLAARLKRWLPRLKCVALLEHHEIHRRQAFWQSGLSEATVVTLDTCGEALARLGGRKLAGTIGLMSRDRLRAPSVEMTFPDASAGLLYAIANHHVGFRQGEEGKTMGLAPYGEPHLFDALCESLQLRSDGSFRFMDSAMFERRLHEYVAPRPPTRTAPIEQRHMDVAYAAQRLTEEIVDNAFRRAVQITGVRDLAYAGGVALNSVANGFAVSRNALERVYIAPNPSDTGQALGCALAGAYEMTGWPPSDAEVEEYAGPEYGESIRERAVASWAGHVERPDELERIAASCIANGHIVARFDGGAEYGPRALGNRSIVCDPRRADMKDFLNARVKHREAFRPFAPSVLESAAGDWFELDTPSPYMLRVVAVRDAVRQRIPAIVHVDGSARVQTVSPSDNPGYWRLIHEFEKITGVPLVLNTSFNVQGEPIVETPADAIACFTATEIDILLMPPAVLSKKPLAEYLAQSRG